LGGLGGELGRQVSLELKFRSAEHAKTFGELVAEELPGMGESFQGRLLLFDAAFQGQMDVGVTVIGGKMDLRDAHSADAGIGQLIANQLLEFFAEAFRKPFITMGVQRSQNNRSVCFS